MPTIASAPSALASASISWSAISRALRNSSSYAPERPPTMSRTPANRSRTMLAPRIASPVTTPRYSVIARPSTPGVVVWIKAQQVGVVVEPLGFLGGRGVPAPADGDRSVVLDREWLVASLPALGRIGVLQPAVGDRAPASHCVLVAVPRT